MTWINRFLFYFGITAILTGESITVRDSYNTLLGSQDPIHATPHINNLIRNNAQGLSEFEKSHLSEIGLEAIGNSIVIINPNLDQSYDTDHFRFFYTLEGSNAVENLDYVINMGNIFEQVWPFYIDTMGFDQPPMGPDDLYEVNIENLPSNYFGYAVAQGSGSSCNGYIRMRNSYSSSAFNALSETDNIKVTAVHEFFHAIQFGYNCYSIRLNSGDLWFMEATAVWSEDELYNGINDLYRYMPSWFSNPDKSINDQSSHMYGTFILFQYIDEHLGGPETIKACWENSKNLAHPTQDVSFEAVDAALEPYNSSLEDAYIRMRIANRILSQSVNAGIYSYNEADGYKTVVNIPPDYLPVPEEYLIFSAGQIETEQDQSLRLYESLYYSLTTESPVKIELTKSDGEFSLSSIVKHQGTEQWTVRTGDELNIDPEIGIEWISLVVSSLGLDETNWDFTLQFKDGYSEDFTFFPPYPNPSYGNTVHIDLQVISEQTIHTKVYDLLGREMWSSSNHFSDPELVTLMWNGLNKEGRRVANGIYLIKLEGRSDQKSHRITLLKKSE